jgi:hypothetical protein
MSKIELQIEEQIPKEMNIAKSSDYTCPDSCRRSSSTTTELTADYGRLTIEKENFRYGLLQNINFLISEAEFFLSAFCAIALLAIRVGLRVRRCLFKKLARQTL